MPLRLMTIAVGLLFASLPFIGRAGDIAAGGRKALACQTCHGLDGLSKLLLTPHLAGQSREYLVKAIKAYRSGERKDEVMAVVAKPLSDRDIDDLAAYYSAIEITVKPPAR